MSQTVRDLYGLEGEYSQNNPGWHEEDSSWKADQLMNLFLRTNISPVSVCEVGCGAGGILESLASRMPNVERLSGYEISPAAFDLCSAKESDRLRFYLADFLEVDDSGYDILLAMDIVEHIPNYYDFLERLRPKAKFKVFHFPLEMNVQSVLRMQGIMRRRRSLGHIHYFSRETALATLEDCGYEIIEFSYTRSAVELNSRGSLMALAKYPRKALYAINSDMAARLLGGFSLLVLAQ